MMVREWKTGQRVWMYDGDVWNTALTANDLRDAQPSAYRIVHVTRQALVLRPDHTGHAHKHSYVPRVVTDFRAVKTSMEDAIEERATQLLGISISKMQSAREFAALLKHMATKFPSFGATYAKWLQEGRVLDPDLFT
jgi:hypothetical protein